VSCVPLLSGWARRLPLADAEAPGPYAIAGTGSADAELFEVALAAVCPGVIKLQPGVALVMSAEVDDVHRGRASRGGAAPGRPVRAAQRGGRPDGEVPR